MKRMAAAGGFAWTDAELEPIRPASSDSSTRSIASRACRSRISSRRRSTGCSDGRSRLDLDGRSRADDRHEGKSRRSRSSAPISTASPRSMPGFRAFITVCADAALQAARAAEADLMAGKVAGPLHGVPWAPKDLCSTKGVRDDRRLQDPRGIRCPLAMRQWWRVWRGPARSCSASSTCTSSRTDPRGSTRTAADARNPWTRASIASPAARPRVRARRSRPVWRRDRSARHRRLDRIPASLAGSRG